MTLQQQITQDAIVLLKQLVATQSFSREENLTGDILEEFFRERNMPFRRKINNLFGQEINTSILNSQRYCSTLITIP
jgi:acetylornithine deacetylase